MSVMPLMMRREDITPPRLYTIKTDILNNLRAFSTKKGNLPRNTILHISYFSTSDFN